MGSYSKSWIKSLGSQIACSYCYFSLIVILQPAANRAKWSTRNFMRGGMIICEFRNNILHTEFDERSSTHASKYDRASVPKSNPMAH